MGSDEADEESLSADAAFEVVGHETRIEILRVLATTDRADRPVSFSDIYGQLDDIDSAHFNYHLNKLVGHFVEKSEAGYDFTRPGRRVAQSILSGTIVGNPMSGLTPVEQRCHHCGGAVEVMYHQGRVAIYCTDCTGTYRSSNHQDATDDVPDEYGFLGLHALPPSGLADRSPTEALAAAHEWSLLDTLSTAADRCPRCSASFDTRVDVCEAHDEADRVCDACGYRHRAVYTASCTECTFDKRLPLGTMLVGTTPLQSFLTGHGHNIPGVGYEAFSAVFKTFEETVESVDPLRVTVTYAIDDDARSVTVDEALDVLAVED